KLIEAGTLVRNRSVAPALSRCRGGDEHSAREYREYGSVEHKRDLRRQMVHMPRHARLQDYGTYDVSPDRESSDRARGAQPCHLGATGCPASPAPRSPRMSSDAASRSTSSRSSGICGAGSRQPSGDLYRTRVVRKGTIAPIAAPAAAPIS